MPDKLTGEEPQFVKDYYGYYKTPRGFHERSINSNGNWNETSVLSFMTMPILTYSNEIKNAVLMIHGENAQPIMTKKAVLMKDSRKLEAIDRIV